MSVLQLMQTLEATPLSAALRSSVWAYPILETIHIAAFALVFGALVLFELRVFGIGRALPIVALLRLAIPLALAAFAVAASSGALLFLSQPTELAAHPAFLAKLGLILIAGANAWWFHRRDSVTRLDGLAKLQAALSMLLWLGVITAGRLIAYL